MKSTLITFLVFFLSSTAFADSAIEARDPDRTCKVEADCVPTCGLGAVSKAWFSANEKSIRDCMDGCMGWGQTVKCLKHKCTVFEPTGKESTACNSSKYRTLIVPLER